MMNSSTEFSRRDFLKHSGLAMTGLCLPLTACRTVTERPAQARRGWKNYLLGSSYYPEWWEESEWEKNFRVMQDLGFSAARMGEFAWSAYEPVEGRFNFKWMDQAVALANRSWDFVGNFPRSGWFKE